MAFKFSNGIVKIQIEDNIFRVLLSQELREKVINAVKKMDMLRKAELTDKEKEQCVIIEFDNIINDILGAGAAEKIFAERVPDAFERIEVLVYIFAEINVRAVGMNADMKRAGLND